MDSVLHDDERVTVNRRHWDELGARHPATPHYGERVERLVHGGTVLRRLELAEVGDVQGKTLLHLQCHLGTETVSWARRGATVSAVDFSANALDSARDIAQRCGVDVRFIESDVLRLDEVLQEEFDVVYTSWGVLGWLQDLQQWSRVVRSHLHPGGFLYLAEFHPTAWMFDERSATPQLRYPYFADEPLRDETDGSYADRTMALRHRTTYNWYYTLGGVVSALAGSGLRIDFLHEWLRTPDPFLQFLVPDDSDERWYRTPDSVPSLPLSFTLRAHRPLHE